LLAVVVVVLGIAGILLIPTVGTALTTVSTDDAFVNSHVTFVAPRVPGQVTKVLVDDNMRVAKGDLLVQLDREPYEIQVEIKQAALAAAESDVTAAKAQARATEALARSQRWKLQSAIEQVDNQVSLLKAKVAAYDVKRASLERARSDFERGRQAFAKGALSQEDFDQRQETLKVAESQVNQAQEDVYQVRVSLGLPPQPAKGSLTDVPPDLNQTFSSVRTALADLTQSIAQLGVPLSSTDATPKEALDNFRKRDPEGNIDRILENLVPNAPVVKQAEAKRLQARRDLEQAQLNLRYCDIFAEIDGQINRRNVNPGNNVQAGQQLMAIRSLTEIWIDANFKETQLRDLRIGQRARIEVDMYGSRREYEGRVTGFSAGTGSTLALLPPQNATGNFVKVVQRLPVRIELTNYDPETETLFAGLSVVPYVYIKEPPTGPDAGKLLQPILPRASAAELSAPPKEGKP
jgi:membrane fusion protein (multidrug efflux system)